MLYWQGYCLFTYNLQQSDEFFNEWSQRSTEVNLFEAKQGSSTGKCISRSVGSHSYCCNIIKQGNKWFTFRRHVTCTCISKICNFCIFKRQCSILCFQLCFMYAYLIHVENASSTEVYITMYLLKAECSILCLILI